MIQNRLNQSKFGGNVYPDLFIRQGIAAPIL